MTKNKKLMLGAATVWPIFYSGVFVFFVAAQFALPLLGIGLGGERVAAAAGGVMMVSFGIIFILHILTILGSLALLVYYVVHALRNPSFADSSNQKLLWVIVLFLGGMIAMPIYWYLHIWKGR